MFTNTELHETMADGLDQSGGQFSTSKTRTTTKILIFSDLDKCFSPGQVCDSVSALRTFLTQNKTKQQRKRQNCKQPLTENAHVWQRCQLSLASKRYLLLLQLSLIKNKYIST